MQRLTESPDSVNIGGKSIPYHIGSAFFVLNERVVLYSFGATHQMLFRTLDRLNPTHPYFSQTDKDSADKSLTGYLKEHEVISYPKITPPDLEWYFDHRIGDHGKFRDITFSGRAWKISIDGKKANIISFWPKSKKVDDRIVSLVIAALRIKGPVQVEFIDSKGPTEYQAVQRAKTRKLKSTKFPQLSERDIADILVKAHISPADLTPQEKLVVKEFRGNGDMEALASRLTRGYSTGAEARFRRTIGDSLD